MQDHIIQPKPPTTELEALIQKALAFVQMSQSENTLRAYRADWADWTGRAEAHHASAIPADPEWLALYLADRAAILRAATLARRLNAIVFYHRQAGFLNSPTYAPLVRATFQGIRREIGTAQTFKRALLTPEIRHIVACCPETLAGFRDKALYLCSFAIAARRSEAAALRVNDLEKVPEGLLVTIRRSKVDQELVGRKVGIPYGADPPTCPVRALSSYLEAANIQSGFVFRAVDQAGRISAHGLHPDSVGYVLKRAAARAGLKVTDIVRHSLRSGLCTEAARRNVPEYLIRRQARFKPGSKTLDRYIRLGEMFPKNAASGLGL
jgi:integrase